MRQRGAVAAAVQPVPVGAPGGDRDRGCFAEPDERCFRAQPGGVVDLHRSIGMAVRERAVAPAHTRRTMPQRHADAATKARPLRRT